mmetsp:Transcript_26286/g.65740  ORF Transcript_26286/g.65740 Transcript_26286/m.65740 type:complete len:108 (-) Transcript_26286:618-941(-)
MRQVAQCIGRVVRSKSDYGIMVLADKRYVRMDKRSKLPQWILGCLDESSINLDTAMGVSVAKHFLRQLAQPISREDQIGVALLSEADVEEMNRKSAAAKGYEMDTTL